MQVFSAGPREIASPPGRPIGALLCFSFAMVDVAPSVHPPRRKKTAAERRLQYVRSEGRMIQRIIKSIDSLDHRGSSRSFLTSGLLEVLRNPTSSSVPAASQVSHEHISMPSVYVNAFAFTAIVSAYAFLCAGLCARISGFFRGCGGVF